MFDEEMNPRVRNVQDKEFNFYTSMIDTSSNNLAIEEDIYEIDPGRYYMGFEIVDKLSNNVGTYKDWIYIESYGYDSLQVSDILPALDILPVGTGPYKRDDVLITGSPHGYYRRNEPINVYYEIYNLTPGTGGGTLFEVNYSLQYLKEGRPLITDFVRRLIVNEQEHGVAMSFRYRGSTKNEYQFLRIDHNLTELGFYELTLKITDLISGKTVEKSVRLRMFDGF
jgi:hypothetical protein